ncbi:MAG: DUF1329 domain-containing protein [Candidatus Binataceae bacterium]
MSIKGRSVPAVRMGGGGHAMMGVTAVAAMFVLAFCPIALARNPGPASPINSGKVKAAEAADSIAPGTKITPANWRQYQRFMSEGMKTVFQGDHFWRFPANGEIAIGPTEPIALPSFFRAATEKNAATSKIVPVASGGYVAEGYQAGVPFPEPLKGNPALIGQRIFWDVWYRFHPRVEQALNCSYVLDQFGNITRTADTNLVYSQLSHVTDPGFPPRDPNAGPYYYTFYGEQTAPEAGKYTTTLNLMMNDPTAEPELYEFVPTLRRSLRLSQSARCAPLFGTDFTFDDSFQGPPGLPQLFKISYLGEKKLISLDHATYHSFDTCGPASNLDPRYYYLGSRGIVPFPNPGSGAWELRDVYVISLKRLPKYAAGYCYGDRVLYIDKENFFPDQEDLYDNNGKLWKWGAVLLKAYAMPGGKPGDKVISISGQNTGYGVNFEDKHVTVFIGLHGCVDGDCKSGGYLDATRYALPEGLMKVMQ